MAALIPIGLQFLDDDGVPLAGGSLTFYAAGGTTPKTIYADEGQMGTLTNPLVLDSEGRVPSAGVWMLGTYRILLKTSSGTTIYDLDDVSVFNPYDWSGLTATVAQINAFVTPAVSNDGKLLQLIRTTDTTRRSSNVAIPLDTSIPQSGEGVEYTQLATSITPLSTTSILKITIDMNIGIDITNAQGVAIFALFQDAGANALNAWTETPVLAAPYGHVHLTHEITNTTLTARTFKLRYGSSNITTMPLVYVNGSAAVNGLFGGVSIASMTIEEVEVL